jgi:hypothetical protein
MKRNPIVELVVVARSPFHIYYEGPATALTATNVIGTFDILPGHADFFSMLTAGQVIIDPVAAKEDAAEKTEKSEKPDKPANPDDKPKPGADGKPISFKISNGIVAVRDNKVMLFVNM